MYTKIRIERREWIVMGKLKEVLKENNIKQSEIASRLNIKSLSTINLKLNGKANFTTKEAAICK